MKIPPLETDFLNQKEELETQLCDQDEKFEFKKNGMEGGADTTRYLLPVRMPAAQYFECFLIKEKNQCKERIKNICGGQQLYCLS